MSMYIITSGEYSDYTVHGYCTTKKKAKRYCAMRNDENGCRNSYSSFEYKKVKCLDKVYNNQKPAFYRYRVRFSKIYGQFYVEQFCLFEGLSMNPDSSVRYNEEVSPDYFVYIGLIEKKSEEDVKKIARDVLMKWLSENEGL